MNSLACPNPRDRQLELLAAEVRERHRCHLRELRMQVVCGCVVLRGQATSFYGKQMAFQEISRLCDLMVIANQIEVREQ